MRLNVLLLCAILVVGISFGQNKEEVLAEAYLLYKSEMASWNGTDIFLDKFPGKRNLISGYFSYTENKLHNCIFYDKEEDPNVLATISFNDDFSIEKAIIDSVSRKLNTREKDLYIIREKAATEISQDTIFKQYNNTNLNPIPLIIGKEKKVFVLTGPQISGVVVLGNDYLLTFDKKNEIKSKKSLHKNIIPIEYSEETKGAVTMHSHLKSTGNLITSTDLCTIMLYQKYAGWDQHIVMSEKNVSL